MCANAKQNRRLGVARKSLENNGAPGAIPTRDLSLRRRALYATELREHKTVNSKWEVGNGKANSLVSGQSSVVSGQSSVVSGQ